MIIITGATGWLGKTSIKYFLEQFNHFVFDKDIMVFGSKDGKLKINNKTINVYNFKLLESLSLEKKITHIFHTAFLTKEKIQYFGEDEYLRINLSIINTIEKVIDTNPTARLAIFSSGAALPFLEEKPNIVNYNYGSLKAFEERKLSKYHNCLILRVFALTGYFIRSPEVFALSEFIHSALNQKIIHINSKGVVRRSYGSAEEIVALSWNWLLSNQNPFSVNASSDILDLLEVAKLIKSIIGDVEICHNIDFNKVMSDYSADTFLFNQKLKEASITRVSIKEQIELSIMGIRENLKKDM